MFSCVTWDTFEAMRVLIVEDEPLIARFLARGLRSEGYTVGVAGNGEIAIRRLEQRACDLVILDLMLPDVDGFEVLREVSGRRLGVPVLVLSARRSVETKVAALDAGASDYLAKPFALDELLARVRALLRRGPADAARPAGDAPAFTLDGPGHALRTADGVRMPLSEREYALLEYLSRTPNQIVSRERILNAVWEYQFDPRSNVVDVYVGRLRRKLEPAVHIETVRGGGYRLVTG
jgi:two-component system, OmpR family, copper resistance phosphate regulon response regulator CusR